MNPLADNHWITIPRVLLTAVAVICVGGATSNAVAATPATSNPVAATPITWFAGAWLEGGVALVGPTVQSASVTSYIPEEEATLDGEFKESHGHKTGLTITHLILTYETDVKVRVECHKCAKGSRLSRGIDGTSKAREQFLPNRATLIIRITAHGKGGRYIEYRDAGAATSKKYKLCLAPGKERPEKCETTPTLTPTLTPTTTTPTPMLPEEKVPPQVTGGSMVGETLSCMPGEWSGTPAPSVTYTWLRDGATMVSAANAPYVTGPEDEGHAISCDVTAVNTAGSKSAIAEAVTVGAPPVNITLPEVTGTPEPGETLHCSIGSWKGYPKPTETVQWLHAGVSISGAVGGSYVVPGSDEGQSIECEVTATNSAGEKIVTSQGVTVVGPPTTTAPPEVTGNPKAGETLQCLLGSWKGYPIPTKTVQWLSGGVPISGAVGSSYLVRSADEGQSISCEVTAKSSVGEKIVTSEGVTVFAVPKNVVLPQISGSAKAGGGLKCSEGSWTGVPEPTFTFEWLRESKPIAGAGEETYEVHGEDEGHTLTCQVTATNSLASHSAASKGVAVPEEDKKRQEEEAAEKKRQEEEAKAREAKEREEKEKNIITSVDNTKGDLAPYSGVFEIAYQPFVAKSTTITYVGVTIGNPELRMGIVPYEAELKLCTTPECGGTGAELAHEKVTVNNYGLTAATFKKGLEVGVKVTLGKTYYLAWTQPAQVKGVEWVTFWHAGATHVLGSQEMEAIVRGYDGEEGETARERISYQGTEWPPAPHVGPFDFAYQNFKAASNRIKTLGVVVGNPKLARGAVSSKQIDVRLCETAECTEGKIWAPEKEPFIINYGITEATVDANVVPGETYFVNWTQPAPVEGEPWVTFWFGQDAKLEDASETEAFAKGYDEGGLTYKPTYFMEKPEFPTVATFGNYENASSPGPEINESETVEVTCKVFAPEIESIEPEGYWYLVHSSPWDDKYYAAANSFLNGGGTSEPVYTDPKVPDC